MYSCQSKLCKDIPIYYSDAWVRGTDASGKNTDVCRWCKKKLVDIGNLKEERLAPAIKTAGCAPTSSEYTH